MFSVAETYPYNAVLLAYRPLAILLKIYGIHPFRMQRPLSKCCCARPSLWLSTVFNSVLVIFSVTVATVVDFLDSEGEIDTTKMSFWAICACALIHMISCLEKGQLNSEVHFKWRRIDKHLGIAVDKALKIWGNKMVISFLILKFMFFGTSAALVFAQEDMTHDLVYTVLRCVVMVLLVWHYCAILVPQMCYYFFCRAIQSRFAILGLAVKRILGDHSGPVGIGNVNAIGQLDISVELEGLRHTYHLLAEVTQDISQLFSPMILLGFLLDSGMICTCMYRLIQMWGQERWSVPLEMVAILTSVIKILVTTLLGSSVTHTVLIFLKLIFGAVKYMKKC